MKESHLALILIGVVIVGVAAWYLIAPAFVVVESDEASPLDTQGPTDTASPDPVINDAMDEMSEQDKNAFEEAVQSMSNVTKEMDEDMPEGPTLLSKSDFVARAHDVEGNAQLIDTSSGLVLRFEDFETINGPNLHVYLASSLGDEDFVDLGSLPATRGSFNIALDDDIDTDTYNKVLVWCVPFRVLFSYADLG